jgi:hypothetical protein
LALSFGQFVHVDVSLVRASMGAHASANAPAIIRRGEPVQLQLPVRILAAIATKRRL